MEFKINFQFSSEWHTNRVMVSKTIPKKPTLRLIGFQAALTLTSLNPKMALIKWCPRWSRITSFIQSSFRGNISSDELQFRPEMLADIYYSGSSAIAAGPEKRAFGGCREHRPREDAQDQSLKNDQHLSLFADAALGRCRDSSSRAVLFGHLHLSVCVYLCRYADRWSPFDQGGVVMAEEMV